MNVGAELGQYFCTNTQFKNRFNDRSEQPQPLPFWYVSALLNITKHTGFTRWLNVLIKFRFKILSDYWKNWPHPARQIMFCKGWKNQTIMVQRTAAHAVQNEEALETVAVLRRTAHTIHHLLAVFRPVLVMSRRPDNRPTNNANTRKAPPRKSKPKKMYSVYHL